ncbi:MAG: succinate dehydrogenase [Candidatus Omnitrophica bacterium]|nr:succinate dehydrogenase [Candidatus Omnitrophota bacterium]
MDVSPSYGRPRPAGGLELRSWIFMRVSGLVLLGLALGHLAVMHLIHSVHEIDYWFVASRYANWGWRLYDLAMLVLAMVHGANGARVIIDDHLSQTRWRGPALGLLYALTGTLTALGVYVALAFQPVARP